MKSIVSNLFRSFTGMVFLALFISTTGCERAVSDLEEPDFSVNPDVFIDTFSAGLNFASFGGAVPAAFQVDEEVTIENSSASMRFEVPDEGDPRGAFAGGAFFTDSPRDLSGYDALTFWAKASEAVSVGVIGFGNDFAESTFQASISDVAVNSNWKKYIIPLPDPSRLTEERGMFFFSTGPIDGKGYTVWVDEVKFENLGTIAHPQAAILNGEDQVNRSFTGITTQINGLVSVFNMPSGINKAVNASPAYFEFNSSNPTTAAVDNVGNVTVGQEGTATVTASLGGVEAEGSLTIESQGEFENAPEPIHAPEDVISLFSNAYTNSQVDFFNGFFEPFQTTGSADFTINGDDVLNYTNFNFVGIQFTNPTVDATSMTHFHMNIFVPNTLQAGARFSVQLIDFGPDGSFGGGDDTASQFVNFTSPVIVSQEWITLDIPLSSFPGLTSRDNLAQIILEGSGISNFFADNIYFRRQ